MAKILFFLSLMLGVFFPRAFDSDRPLLPEDYRVLTILVLIIVAFLGLAWWDTRKKEKFLGLSFSGWSVGFVLSFVVGVVCGFFV